MACILQAGQITPTRHLAWRKRAWAAFAARERAPPAAGWPQTAAQAARATVKHAV